MKVDGRPYSGNWSLDIQNKYRTVVSWTPDAIVQFNGDTTLPGCPECKNRIDFSSFITSVNVGGGVESSGASCDISLVIPKSFGDVVYRDGKFILTTGIEVNVYYRGFFKTKDLSLKDETVSLTINKEDGSVDSEEIELNEIEVRPYYPVFHGFIKSVSVSLKDNSYSVSIQTGNMLSFWDSQMINTQQGYFAANPKEARGTINLKGHVYTNMTPHQIIYDLYRDTGGSPEGTNFALQQKSNLLNKIQTGQQFYSLYLRYLENRWGSGSWYKLRMFGASGRAYTALEQSILVDTSPEGKDNQFRKVVRQQLKPHSVSKKNAGSALSNLMKAGMVVQDPQGRVLRTLDVRQLPSILGKKEDPVNVLSLQEFITEISSLGQVNFMDSNFDSKLSIANKIAEKIGYEFYQDMDGDLVFKPPMYNMDTSNDRVYRINREDTLDISYEHNEPEFTYVICSGGPFRNIKVSNLEGEWGVKGMYVDYKLVAKYGWKSLSFDTTYYNSARKAFYAAVVALDNSNKATEGCSITIPLRPELKPGYPVYVEENDCFYYVEGVNHNFSYGGDCTTSLTLTAQRKKFIPPGRNEVKYSDNPAKSVDLGDTSLPEKIMYSVNSRDNLYGEKVKTKKVVGFPNVVMALDPYKMDPSTFTHSINYQQMGQLNTETREAYRNMLLMEGFRLNILRAKEGSDIFKGPWILKIEDKEVELGLEAKDQPYLRRSKNGRVTRSKISKNQANSRKIILGESALEMAVYNKNKAREKASKLLGKGKFSTSKSEKANKILDQAQKRMNEAIQSLALEGSSQGNPDLQGISTHTFTILDLIYQVRAQRKLNLGQDEKIRTSEILRLLENKKNSFAPHLPGYYRYYSSSHPSREHQGPSIPTVNTSQDGELPNLRFDPPGIADRTKFSVVQPDFIHGANAVTFSEESEGLVAGINTRTLYTEGFSYVPTKDIKTLTFQVNQTLVEREVEIGIRFDPNVWEKESGFGNAFRNNLIRVIKSTIIKNFKPTSTLGQIKSKIFKARNRIPNGYPADFYLNGAILGDNTKISEAVPNVTARSKIANVLSANLYTLIFSVVTNEFPHLFVKWEGSESDRSRTILKLLNKVQKTFRPSIKGGFYKGRSKKKTVREFVNGKKVSPVFPISDHRGYEVFGAYQYGRGLSPAKNTVFDALLKQDPASALFSQSERNEILKNISSKKSIAEFENEYRERVRGKIEELYKTEGVEHVQRLYKAYGLDIDSEDRDPEKGFTFNTLANRMMTGSDEQVIQNVPRSLADIRPDLRDQAMCSCKGTTSEASILYDAVNLQDSRVDIENPLVAEAIRASRSKTPAWVEHQKALRAEGMEVNTSSGKNLFKEVVKETGQAFKDLGNIAEAIDDAVDDLTDAEKYSEAYNRRNS
tara:strand:+ start:10 stop:4179 length:4170 start_codon:yes stop_codon:yes gene_type:complete